MILQHVKYSLMNSKNIFQRSKPFDLLFFYSQNPIIKTSNSKFIFNIFSKQKTNATQPYKKKNTTKSAKQKPENPLLYSRKKCIHIF